MAVWLGASDEHTRQRSVRSEQRCQTAKQPQPSGAGRRLAVCFVARRSQPTGGDAPDARAEAPRASHLARRHSRQNRKLFLSRPLVYSTHVSLSPRGTSGRRVGEGGVRALPGEVASSPRPSPPAGPAGEEREGDNSATLNTYCPKDQPQRVRMARSCEIPSNCRLSGAAAAGAPHAAALHFPYVLGAVSRCARAGVS